MHCIRICILFSAFPRSSACTLKCKKHCVRRYQRKNEQCGREVMRHGWPGQMFLNFLVSEPLFMLKNYWGLRHLYLCVLFICLTSNNRRQLDSHICLSIYSVVLCYLIEVYEENVASCKCVTWKGSILVPFSDNCGYALLLFHL